MKASLTYSWQKIITQSMCRMKILAVVSKRMKETVVLICQQFFRIQRFCKEQRNCCYLWWLYFTILGNVFCFLFLLLNVGLPSSSGGKALQTAQWKYFWRWPSTRDLPWHYGKDWSFNWDQFRKRSRLDNHGDWKTRITGKS